MEFLKRNIAAIVIIVTGVLAATAVSCFDSTYALPSSANNDSKGTIFSAQQVAALTISYINTDLLQDGSTASLVSIVEQNQLYKLKIKIMDNEFDVYASVDGQLLFPEAIDMMEEKNKETTTIGNFTAGENEVCLENGKPVVYFFGSPGCPHCVWEHPIIEEVAAKFGDEIIFHNNMDASADMDIFSQYSTGGVPTTVLGCKYWRVGSGQSNGEEGEAKILTALICKLTNNQPGDICAGFQDLIDQVE